MMLFFAKEFSTWCPRETIFVVIKSLFQEAIHMNFLLFFWARVYSASFYLSFNKVVMNMIPTSKSYFLPIPFSIPWSLLLSTPTSDLDVHTHVLLLVKSHLR